MILRLSIALACLLGVTSASTATASAPSRCATTCVYTFHAGLKVRDWHTPWRSARDDVVAITVSIGGEVLKPETIDDQELRYYGHGTVIRATVPAEAGAVRLRLATVDQGVRVRVKIRRFDQP